MSRTESGGNSACERALPLGGVSERARKSDNKQSTAGHSANQQETIVSEKVCQVKSNSLQMAAPKDKIEVYLRAEFNAMDKDKDRQLTARQFYELLSFLGYNKGMASAKALLKKVDKNEDSLIKEDDFVNVMKSDPEVVRQTQILRSFWESFDADRSGKASKVEVLEKLNNELGIDKKILYKKVEAMDANVNGFIEYEEFLQVYFQGKMNR